MNGSFTNDRLWFVLEVGPLTPVEWDGTSCLGTKKTLVDVHAF